MRSTRSDQAGFTLIEIIITLTIAAILSVMLVQFMGTSISRSAQPTFSIQEGMALQGVFENLSADYKRLLLSDQTPLETFKTKVDSGAYGTYTVTASDYILFDSNHIEAPCNLNQWDCKILKVTLAMGDHSLTALFAR